MPDYSVVLDATNGPRVGADPLPRETLNPLAMFIAEFCRATAAAADYAALAGSGSPKNEAADAVRQRYYS